jgi:hypothetical protein
MHTKVFVIDEQCRSPKILHGDLGSLLGCLFSSLGPIARQHLAVHQLTRIPAQKCQLEGMKELGE